MEPLNTGCVVEFFDSEKDQFQYLRSQILDLANKWSGTIINMKHSAMALLEGLDTDLYRIGNVSFFSGGPLSLQMLESVVEAFYRSGNKWIIVDDLKHLAFADAGPDIFHEMDENELSEYFTCAEKMMDYLAFKYKIQILMIGVK